MRSGRKASCPSGWWFAVWLVRILHFLVTPLREEWNLSNLRKQAEVEHYPNWSLKEILQQGEYLYEASRLPGDTPEQYYVVLAKYMDLNRAIERYRVFKGWSLELNKLELRALPGIEYARLLSEYEKKFGQAAMRQAAAQVEDEPPFNRVQRPVRDVLRTEANHAWLVAYSYSVLLAPALFYLLLRRNGMLVWVELLRMIPSCLIWPFMWRFYARMYDVQVQYRRARQFCAYALSAFLSFASMGGVAKAQQGTGGGKKDNVAFVMKWSVFSEFLNYPGVRVNKNAVFVTDARVFWKKLDVGIQGSLGLGKHEFLKHHPGNEIQFQIGLRERWRRFETYLRAAYSMNDFEVGGVERSSDDQLLFDAEISFLGMKFLKPFMAYRYFYALGGRSPHPGSFWKIGFRRLQPISFFGRAAPLTLETQFAFSDGALGRGGKRGGYVWWRLGASLQVQLTERSSVIPQLLLQVAEGSQRGRPQDYTQPVVFVYGLGFQYQF